MTNRSYREGISCGLLGCWIAAMKSLAFKPCRGEFKNGSRRREEADFGGKNTSASLCQRLRLVRRFLRSPREACPRLGSGVRRLAGFCAAVGIGLLRLEAAPGFVTGWGANEAHQIEAPLNLADAVAVSAGASHAVALRQDGSLAAWGDNAFGQTNVPAEATNITAVAAGHRHSLALRTDGVVIGWGENLF